MESRAGDNSGGGNSSATIYNFIHQRLNQSKIIMKKNKQRQMQSRAEVNMSEQKINAFTV